MENALLMLVGIPTLATIALGCIIWFVGALRKESFEQKMAIAILESGHGTDRDSTGR